MYSISLYYYWELIYKGDLAKGSATHVLKKENEHV